jgi:predicted N-acetyltransferase YhbS
MEITIHPFEDRDLDAADEVLRRSFGGEESRRHDLQIYRNIQPDGMYAARREETLVGLVGMIEYGIFAQVGYMAVHPSEQRQGIGKALMEHVLSRLENEQVPMVTLDGSKMGQPLYEKLGFYSLDDTQVFVQTKINAHFTEHRDVLPISEEVIEEIAEWDAVIFGANRRNVLQALSESHPDRGFYLREENGQIGGYLFGQYKRIGPWVMRKATGAANLLEAALSLPYDVSPALAVPSTNPEAGEILTQYGFEMVRTNKHMLKGSGSPPGDRRRIYAQASMAIG